MANSIYAYRKPEAANTDNEYFKDYFAERPYILDSPIDEDGIFVYIKPRFSEKGLSRFTPFMDTLRAIKPLVNKICPDDTPEGRKLEWTMKQTGYEDLIELLKDN
jgi:hypothetical protein